METVAAAEFAGMIEGRRRCTPPFRTSVPADPERRYALDARRALEAYWLRAMVVAATPLRVALLAERQRREWNAS